MLQNLIICVQIFEGRQVLFDLANPYIYILHITIISTGKLTVGAPANRMLTNILDFCLY